jgi:hypothetical protein
MPKIKNIFTKARMNKDLDERLVPGGEYREAQNISIATSEDSDVGAIENIRGNKKLTTQEVANMDGTIDAVTIGSYVDVSNDRIFWFTTTFTSESPNADIRTMQRAILEQPKGRMKVVMKEGNGNEEVLASGLYLNFTTTHPITGVNTIGNYLYFTDNYNQPRVIDIDLARSNTSYYVNAQEEKISVAKVAPYLPPMLNKPNTISIAFDTLVAGTGYSSTNDVVTTGGTGTGLKVNTTANVDGNITAVTISDDDIGYGYSVGDVITITGGNADATITLTAYPNTADGQTLITSDPTSLTGVKSDYMQERFIRFAYRYKYKDGTYSIISPFTQPVFKPLNDATLQFNQGTNASDFPHEPVVSVSSQDVVERGIVPIMQNAYDKVIMRVPLPTISPTTYAFSEHFTSTANITTTYENDRGLRIESIEILLKESNGISVKLVDTINIDAARNETTSPFSLYTVTPASGTTHYRQAIEYTYKAKEPFKVLPEKQLIRVSDDVPVRAKAQEVVGNRIVYGNITSGYDIPNDEAGNKGISFFLSSDNKGNVEKGITSGHFYYNTQTHKFHTVKQRRTYQAGIVLMDIFGRMSPVIPSTYKSDDLSDTHTVVAETDSYAANTDGSWENTFKTYGKALNIDFQDSRIVPTEQTHDNYENNPNGWFAWKVVIKQTEQDYYNVYTAHPMNNWTIDGHSVTDHPRTGTADEDDEDQDQVIAGKFDQTSLSRSWFSLTNDNINKVPRSVKDIDEFKDGVAGSEVQLYPKVVQIDANIGFAFNSKMGVDGQEYIDVMSIGDAKSQGLFSKSNAKNGPFSNGALKPRNLQDKDRVYAFLQDFEKNPTVAEIPNLYNEKVNVRGEFESADGTNAVLRSTDNLVSDSPFGYPNTKDKGLTVFETKPFESNLDIYYETATCGTVSDLNAQCAAASSGPTNIRITNTVERESYSAGITADFPEGFDYSNNSVLQKQIGELTATVDDPLSEGHTISNFQLMAVTNNDGSDGTDLGKFAIDQEDDITVVRHSAKQSTASAANAINLTDNTVSTIVRFKYTELLALSSVGTTLTNEATAISSIANTGAGFYKIWFYDNHSTNITDQRQCVVEVDANHDIVAITNEQAGPGGGALIDARFMLKVGHQFAFNNNSSDDFDITIRATQSNNASSLQNITVSVTNSDPVGTNANGFIDNQSTYGGSGPKGGYTVGTISAVNGSANSALNQSGLTAALSGTNASMFTITESNTSGTFTIRTNNTFTFSGFFGSDNISGQAITVTFTDNGSLTGTAQFTIYPRFSTAIDGHWDSVDACTIKYSQPATTYYVKSSVGGGSGSTPSQSGGVYAGNTVYTDKLLNNSVGSGTFTVSGLNPRHATSSSGVISASTYDCPIA